MRITHKLIALVLTGLLSFSTIVLGADEKKDNLSVFINGGYGAGIGGHLIDQSQSFNTILTIPTKNQEHYLNYGGGINLALGANYKLFENLYAQAALRFAWGVPSIKADLNISVPQYSNTTTYKPGMWGIGLSVLPRFRILDLINAYTGVGCGLFFSYCDIDYSIQPSLKGSISTWPSLGFTGLIGAEYPIMDELVVFGEISFDAMNFQISNYKRLNATHNGLIAEVYTGNSTTPPELSPYNIPGTNIALRIGARFIVF